MEPVICLLYMRDTPSYIEPTRYNNLIYLYSILIFCRLTEYLRTHMKKYQHGPNHMERSKTENNNFFSFFDEHLIFYFLTTSWITRGDDCGAAKKKRRKLNKKSFTHSIWYANFLASCLSVTHLDIFFFFHSSPCGVLSTRIHLICSI